MAPTKSYEISHPRKKSLLRHVYKSGSLTVFFSLWEKKAWADGPAPSYLDLASIAVFLADTVIGPICSLYILASFFRSFWRKRKGHESKDFPLIRFVGFINMIPALILLLTFQDGWVHEWFLVVLWVVQVLIGLLPWLRTTEIK